ncbi:NAD(P)-dependent oxidoreductase [Nocardiopsis gilva YIM 90087]|uniref:NAD(P)-dependent oxidoreductase n=1 Tax=Nocardiopsis gilva YIM 90087 TaxID=1235441 RepID=A0A223S1J8_9ACTN|nr:NAD(P)-dependent oxidoreductase [Nocardiopsis gilva]ASU82013.1 NAD(P)-dependent oxidoreductase [Nocardiopsis gilva YIM 90087]
MRFLVTGSTGFIGGHLVRYLVSRDHSVTALVRDLTRAGDLTSSRVNLIEGDLVLGADLADSLDQVDCVLHLAGATMSGAEQGYFRVNATGTRKLCEALARVRRPPRLVFCSSLAAAGPSVPGRPRKEDQPVAPVSAYGESKLAAEHAVRGFADRVSAVAVRPPIVYGPGDPAFVPTLRTMVRCGVVPKRGFGTRAYSVIHVDDLCAALLAAAESDVRLHPEDQVAGVYTVSDGFEYRLEDLAAAMAEALGRRAPAVVPLPGPMIGLAALAAELAGRLLGTAPTFNRDKARELRCPAWTCSTENAVRDLGFHPTITLRTGLTRTLESSS